MKTFRNTISIVTLSNEQYLLEQIAQGDESSFRKVFEAYRKPLYAYIIYLIKSEVLADEILQDVFLRVWLNRSMLREVRTFRAWLFTIAKNRIIDAIKLQAKETLLLETAPAPVLNCEAEDRIREKEYASLLNEAISQLSPKQQLIYQLSREKGLKLNEIAIKLNLSSNTVKSHLMHALRAIRKYVQPHLHAILAVLLLCKYF